MNRKAPSARLVAIPIVAAGLLFGSTTADALQDESPVVPVETPVPPVLEATSVPPDVAVVETPEPGVVETPDPETIVVTPDPSAATEVPAAPEPTAASSGLAGPGPYESAGGEPPADEGATINAVVDPQPPTDQGEAPKPLPRGKISPQKVKSVTGAPAPAASAALAPAAAAAAPVPASETAPAPGSAPAPALAPAPVPRMASEGPAVIVPAAPVAVGGRPETGAVEARSRPGVPMPASRPDAIALPSTGTGTARQAGHAGVIAVTLVAGLVALGVASGRCRRGV